MKLRKQVLPARFARATRFKLAPPLDQSLRAAQKEQFDLLRNRLLRRLLDDAIRPDLNAPLQRAANEAAALAWTTPIPLLVFPALLEEKAGRAKLQLQKQGQIRLRSEMLFDEAA